MEGGARAPDDMRITRKEILLIVGLMASIAVAFSDQIIDLSSAPPGVVGIRHIAFLPGLAFMAIVLLVYVQTKRQEVEVLAAKVAEEARESQERASELERLVAFWKALTQSLDIGAVRDTVAEHLPDIARSAETWLVTGEGGTWAGMFGPATVRTASGETGVTDFALDVLAQPDASATPEGLERDGQNLLSAGGCRRDARGARAAGQRCVGQRVATTGGGRGRGAHRRGGPQRQPAARPPGEHAARLADRLLDPRVRARGGDGGAETGGTFADADLRCS